MNNPHPSPGAGISRRHLIAGLGAAGGAAGLLAAFPGGSVVAGPAIPSLGSRPASFPEALQPPSPDLTYVGIDAAAFAAVKTTITPVGFRYFNDESGAGANDNPDVLLAPLSLPSGSVIRQVNVAWVGTGHRVQIWRRQLSDPSTLDGTGPTMVFDQPLPNLGAGSHSDTFPLSYTVSGDSSYSIRVPVDAGESILSVVIGYEPPSSGFKAIDPPTRPLDTRQPGGTGAKLQPGAPLTLDLGLPAGAKAAVINLTITGTETSFGYVSVYRAGIAWPGNSSINWSSPELTAANAVITAVDEQGRIDLRAGEAATHAIVDVLGYFD